MPMYNYRCPVCNHTQEHLRPIDKRNDPVGCSNGLCDRSKPMTMELKAYGWTPMQWGDTQRTGQI